VSSPRSPAPPSRRRRGALDAVAFASLVALDARRVLIAVKVARGWSVHGSAARVDNSQPTLLRGATGLPLDIPVVVQLASARDGEWRLTVPRSASARRPTIDQGDLGQADDGAPQRLVAIASRCRDRSTALLVAEQPMRPDALERLPELVTAVADAVVAADEGHRARLRDSLQEREDERRRWARELHDETLQQLGALQVLLTSARRDPGTGERAGSADIHAAVDQAAELVQSQIISLRHLINELRPSALDELGLRAPLEALAERTEQLTQMHVDMQVSLPYADGQVSTRLMPDIELAVYRVVQEALTNAARHSHGTRARVVVVEDGDQVRVEVSDNGTGAVHTTGFGIEGMRERATLAGGHLEVLPGGSVGHPAGRGTTVRMVVPAVHRTDDTGR
jgi:signal transduction histidine kinase